MKTIVYEMRKNALRDIDNHRTEKAYKDAIAKFANYMKQTYGVRSYDELNRHSGLKTEYESWGKKDLAGKPLPLVAFAIQKYADWLSSGRNDGHHLSAASIHTYLAGVCLGAGVNMTYIEKPIRTATDISKGRRNDPTSRSAAELQQAQHQRLVSVAEATGLRRSEIGRIRICDLKRDVCGHACIEVKGKGGRIQRQRLLPGDELTIRAIAGKRQGTEYLISRKEMKNDIDLHSIRRAHAQKAYTFYTNEIKSGKAGKLRADLLRTWDAYHPKNAHNYSSQHRNFIKEVFSDKPYYLRGSNAQRARAIGLPEKYDRLALMCVSVWHLAHWRADVTVRHYMM